MVWSWCCSKNGDGCGSGCVFMIMRVDGGAVELRSMAFPSAVTKAGWNLDSFDTAVNVDLKTVS